MRPIRLHLKGFTSFKEETVVPFERLDRFVVCGPTGAGKSSLFDAMTFALFADAPRINSGKIADLVSLGRKSFAVTLDFRVGNRSYRVYRARARAGSSVGQPDHLHEIGTVAPIASGTKEVNEAIKNLLGLSYDHFIQAVFLPQGKFAELLRSQPSARQNLLKELLRLLIYDRMREKAGQEKANYTGQKEQTERRLREDFEGVTEEARAELAQKLAGQRDIVVACDRDLPSLRLLWEQARCDREATIDLEAKRIELARLQTSGANIAEAQRQVEEATRAAAVVPLLDQADAALQDATRRQKLLAQAEHVRAQLEAAHQAAVNAFEKAKAEAESLSQLRERLQRLAEATGKLRLCSSLMQQIEQGQQRQHVLLTERAERTGNLEGLAREIAALETSCQEAEAGIAHLGYDAQRHQRLEAQRDNAVRLRTERAQLATAVAQAEQSESKAAEAQAAVEQAQAREIEVKNAKRLAQKCFNDAERRLRAAEDVHKAAHLRAGLQPGELCPVCGQGVAVAPASLAVPELDGCQQAFREAKLDLSGADLALSQHAEHLSAARTAADGFAQQSVNLRDDANRLRDSIEQQTQLLAEALGDFDLGPNDIGFAQDAGTLPIHSTLHFPHPASPPRSKNAVALTQRVGKTSRPALLVVPDVADFPEAPAVPVSIPMEDRVLDAVRAAAALKEQHRRATQRLSELHNQRSLKLRDQDAALAHVGRIDLDLQEAVQKLAENRESLASIQAEIRQAVATVDPAAESQHVQSEIDRLQRLLADAGWAVSEANTKRVEAQARAASAAGEATAATTKAQDLAAQTDQAMRQAGFAQSAVVRAAYRTPEQLQALQARIVEHAGAIQAVQARLAELEKSLDGRRVAQDECRRAEQAHLDCQTRRQEADTQANRLTDQLQRLSERLERSRQLRADLTAQERLQGIYEQLAKDLRSDAFQAFVLEETLAGLVRDASDQLLRLTGDRYGLFFADERIHVIDNDNASERRGIETLSGGETFLASLALALALSEQVQKIAGAVHLDCLFIDEGFGALDPETLRTVCDTIRALQVGGRMVGVITHLPELKDEFDQRILVEKKEGTSRALVECG